MCKKSYLQNNRQIGYIIKDESGKVRTESDEIKNRWKNYCENLYASQEETKDTNISTCGDDEPDILLPEVQQEATKKLKNQKAPGIDDIPGDSTYKQADDSVAIVLQKLCNSVWKSKFWPEDWKKSVFLTLPKKRDASECKNRRTIVLTPHTSKILLHIINERLRPHIERELPAWQVGFMKGRGIANIRHIMEMCFEFQQKIFLCFIDYSKAFDCVRYSALWTALQEMGIPSHLIHLIRKLYDGQAACVRTEKGNSDCMV